MLLLAAGISKKMFTTAEEGKRCEQTAWIEVNKEVYIYMCSR
jgi:hypothetical protein